MGSTLWKTFLHKKLWKITRFNGTTHYQWPVSIAMLNYQRVNHLYWSLWPVKRGPGGSNLIQTICRSLFKAIMWYLFGYESFMKPVHTNWYLTGDTGGRFLESGVHHSRDITTYWRPSSGLRFILKQSNIHVMLRHFFFAEFSYSSLEETQNNIIPSQTLSYMYIS